MGQHQKISALGRYQKRLKGVFEMKKIVLFVMVFLFSVLLIVVNALGDREEIWFFGEDGSYWTYDFGSAGELTLTLGSTNINGKNYRVLKEQGLDLGEEDLFSLPFSLNYDMAIADTQNQKFLEWLKNFARNNHIVLQVETILKNDFGIKEPIVEVRAEITNLYGIGQRKLLGLYGTLLPDIEGIAKDSDGRTWYCWEVLRAFSELKFSNGDGAREDVVILGRYCFNPEPLEINGETKTVYSLNYFLYYTNAPRKDPAPILEFPIWNLKVIPGIGVVKIVKSLNEQELFNGSLKSYKIFSRQSKGQTGQSVDLSGKVATTWGSIKK